MWQNMFDSLRGVGGTALNRTAACREAIYPNFGEKTRLYIQVLTGGQNGCMFLTGQCAVGWVVNEAWGTGYMEASLRLAYLPPWMADRLLLGLCQVFSISASKTRNMTFFKLSVIVWIC